jgi:hypothetical protein
MGCWENCGAANAKEGIAIHDKKDYFGVAASEHFYPN